MTRYRCQAYGNFWSGLQRRLEVLYVKKDEYTSEAVKVGVDAIQIDFRIRLVVHACFSLLLQYWNCGA